MSQTPEHLSPNPLPAPLQELRSLIRDRKITKDLIESAQFRDLWAQVKRLMDHGSPDIFWLTVSSLGRMASISKPAEREVEPLLKASLSEHLPPFTRPADGDDRYYLAKSVEYVSRAELVDIAFKELAAEETAETARRVWAGIASASSPTVSSFLQRLNQETDTVVSVSKLSPDALCRKLRRIIASIEDFIAASDTDSGDELGKQLRALFIGQLPPSGPEDRALRDVAAQDFLSALQKIVRLNFSARNDPQCYASIMEMRGWWKPASPSQDFEKLARSIARLGMESLVVFAKQGVRNKPLRDGLVDAVGERFVSLMAEQFVERSPSLDAITAYWIVHGSEPQEQRSERALDALSEAKLDEYIARLLIAVAASDQQIALADQAIQIVRDIMPDEASIIEAFLRRTAPIKQWSLAVARARRLELFPDHTDQLRFDPALHVGGDRIVPDAVVRVLSPGVTKEGARGLKVIIVKAEVEQK
jgi:hypothetical protein